MTGRRPLTPEERARKKREMDLPALATRLWSRVDRSGGPDACWPWQACTTAAGYGVLRVQNRPEYSHRLAWTLSFGTIPPGYYVCHRCDNPACCNPAHLFLGTPADNAADMAAKGRSTRGERNPRARLTQATVLALRQQYAAGMKQADLVRAFGLNHSTVTDIVRGKSWRYCLEAPDAQTP